VEARSGVGLVHGLWISRGQSTPSNPLSASTIVTTSCWNSASELQSPFLSHTRRDPQKTDLLGNVRDTACHSCLRHPFMICQAEKQTAWSVISPTRPRSSSLLLRLTILNGSTSCSGLRPPLKPRSHHHPQLQHLASTINHSKSQRLFCQLSFAQPSNCACYQHQDFQGTTRAGRRTFTKPWLLR
jgi:hypothetical protein